MRRYKVNLKFGRKVKLARRKVKISQEELAERVKISRNHMGRVERGEVNLSLVLASKIALALKVNLKKLL